MLFFYCITRCGVVKVNLSTLICRLNNPLGECAHNSIGMIPYLCEWYKYTTRASLVNHFFSIKLRLYNTIVLSIRALHLWPSFVVGILYLLCAFVHLMCSALMLGNISLLSTIFIHA
jgi:hypothetical protein